MINLKIFFKGGAGNLRRLFSLFFKIFRQINKMFYKVLGFTAAKEALTAFFDGFSTCSDKLLH